MHNAWRGPIVAALAVLTLASARSVAAEPVDSATWVTSGGYFTQSGMDFFNFVGPTVDFHQTSGATPPKVFASTCNPCAPGDTVNLSFRHPPFDANGFTQFVELGTGFGHTLNSPDVDLSFNGSFKFMAMLAVFPDVMSPTVTIETPFSFRGWLNATFTSGSDVGSGGYGARLRGLGTATQTFMRDGSVYRAIGRPTYTVKAATPEPSSLLLLGTGIAALGRRLRRKK